MTKRPKILLTNDDGIHAPGLRSLWQALVDYADLTIVAPMDDMSGSGAGITLKSPLRLEPVSWDRQTPAWKTSGKPADCVKLGLGALLTEKPDLVLSGINRGSNLGRTLFYSGTVGGVIEGALKQIPGIAFSCEDFHNPDYQAAEKYVLSLVQHTLEHPLPFGTVLNVNFPDASKPHRGFKFARQGFGFWGNHPDERTHPTEGTPYFWLGGDWQHHDENENSDVALLQQGYITVVPIRVDELTHHDWIASHQEVFEMKMNPEGMHNV